MEGLLSFPVTSVMFWQAFNVVVNYMGTNVLALLLSAFIYRKIISKIFRMVLARGDANHTLFSVEG